MRTANVATAEVVVRAAQKDEVLDDDVCAW